MTDPVTLLLHDGTLLVFTWTRDNVLSVDLWKPSHKDCAPWLLSGSTLLSEQEAKSFFARIMERQPLEMTQKERL